MRKRRPEAMGSLDSLLDTMTNAVGILIVVVAVTQLNVADTVRQIQALANLKSLQVEAAKEALKERHRMEKLIDRISMYWGSLDTYMVLPEGVTVEDIKRLIPDLEMVAEDPSVLPPRNDVPLLTEVMQAEIQVAEAQKKLDEQKAAMDYRERQSKPIRDLSLPVVRSVNNLRPLIFFCRNGNIYPFDADGLVKIFNNAVREHLEITTPRLEIQTADFPRLELHFATNVIGNDYIRIRLRNMKDSLLLTFEPLSSRQGETEERIGEANSLYTRMIRGADAKRVFIQYHVWGDSFLTYMRARDMAEEAGLRARWIPYATGEPMQIQVRGEGMDAGRGGETVD
ncbi:MAG: hypothetical protein GXY55_06610 [Phycisphaerae bacterium]|nr:hypothetical protein [Phycisphaerae bacterium]